MKKKKQTRFVIVAASAEILMIICLCVSVVRVNSYEPEFFSREELNGYRPPILFFSSSTQDEKYFMVLNQPEQKIALSYDKIWDYNAVRQTFLFSMETDKEEKIYEYDLKSGSYQCIFDESDVTQHLYLLEKSEFKSVFYHFSEQRVSGMYGGNLFIYDTQDKKVIYKRELPEGDNGDICAWLDPQTYLYRPFFETFEVCLGTGEMKKVECELGFGWVLSDDKTIGCSYGNEEWFFSPILVWDTSEYHSKRFREGYFTCARMQISDDNQYIMFARSNAERQQVLCLRIDDEKLCTVYETPDHILDLLW